MEAGPRTKPVLEAALLLDIFRLQIGDLHRRAYQDDAIVVPWDYWEIHLAPWAVEAATRGGHRSGGAEASVQIEKLTAGTDPEPVDAEIRAAVLDELRELRVTRGQFPKGTSGNRSGRAITRAKFIPPFPWLQVLVVLDLRGKLHEVTRSEGLIYQLQRKALQDVALARKLGDLLAKQHLRGWTPEDWRERYHRQVEAWQAPELLPPPKTAYDCLRVLGMVSAQAKKSFRLEPWLVEMALQRLDAPLELDAQHLIMRVTSRPYGDVWPEWWDPSVPRKPLKLRQSSADEYIVEVIRC